MVRTLMSTLRPDIQVFIVDMQETTLQVVPYLSQGRERQGTLKIPLQANWRVA